MSRPLTPIAYGGRESIAIRGRRPSSLGGYSSVTTHSPFIRVTRMAYPPPLPSSSSSTAAATASSSSQRKRQKRTKRRKRHRLRLEGERHERHKPATQHQRPHSAKIFPTQQPPIFTLHFSPLEFTIDSQNPFPESLSRIPHPASLGVDLD